MEEANKNLQNLLKECREKNLYYTQKLNEQKAKEKELNFENLYRKPSSSNTEVKLTDQNKRSLEIRSNKEIDPSPNHKTDLFQKKSQLNENNLDENSQINNENTVKNYLYNHANEIYDSQEEENDEMKYTEENKQDQEEVEEGDYQDEENSQNDENYMSEEDKNINENNDELDSQEGRVGLENDDNLMKVEYFYSNFRENNRFNKYESAIKPQNINNQLKEKGNENIMPNTFFSNQEKIKNNFQTNLPLKMTEKNIQPIVKEKVHKNGFQTENNTQNFNNVNNNLKYSGRSYSEESQRETENKPERLNKYDLSLSDDSISESSEKIKSKQKNNNANKNLNRSSDSENQNEEPTGFKKKAINNQSNKPILSIHQKIGAVQTKPLVKDSSTFNSSKVKGTHHTAYTFSTIVKMKKEEKPNKTSIFKDKVLGKKYNGKSDRVAIYQYLKNEWSKTPILKKNPTNNTNSNKEEVKVSLYNHQEKNKENTLQQKVRNIRRPLSYYKKF